MHFKRFFVLHNDHGVSESLISVALRRIDTSRRKGQNVIEFGRVIGFNELVEVSENDEFYEAVRGDRPYTSRFVKYRFPETTTKLAIVWQRVNDNVIRVITAYFTNRDNSDCPDEPNNILRKHNNGKKISMKQIEEALDFWSKHAFIESVPRNYVLQDNHF